MIWKILAAFFFGCMAMVAIRELYVLLRDKRCGYDRVMAKLEAMWKAGNPDRNFIGTRFLGFEPGVQVYGVLSQPPGLVMGGGTWTYYRYHISSDSFEKFTVERGETYWQTPTK